MTEAPTEHRAKIAEARNVLGEVIARARFASEPTVLINRGKEAAVIVPFDFYEQARRDRAQLQAIADHLEELAGQEQKPDVRSKRRAIGELLDMADRRAAEAVARD